MVKRPRDDSGGTGSRLDLDCLNVQENARVVDTLRSSEDMVNVVVVRGNMCDPPGIEKVTNSILYLGKEFPRSVPSKLRANPELHVYIFQQFIALDNMPVKPFDWTRMHAAHVIMHKRPRTFEKYASYFATLKQISNNVYQLLEPGVNLAWAHDAGVTMFVIADEDYNLKETLGRLPPGSLAFHLDTLQNSRSAWSEQAIAALQSGPVPKFRKVEADEEKVQGDLSLRLAAASIRDEFRDELNDMLGGPIQNPKSTFQLYAMLKTDSESGNPWLNYLYNQHPRFCYFNDAMFLYQPFPVDGTAPAEIPFDVITRFPNLRQSDVGRIGNLALGVHDGLLSDLDECEQPLMVGNMWIFLNDAQHSNAIVIDREKKTIARFEPLGWAPLEFYDQQNLDELFRDMVRRNPKYFSEYIPPTEFSCEYGPQEEADGPQYNDFEVDQKKHFGDKNSGWCHLTSLMFLHHVIAHPEKTLKEVESMMSSKPPGQMALELRSYANSIVRSTTVVLEGCNQYLCTTVRKSLDMMHVYTCMRDSYPPTDFRRANSLVGTPQTLVRCVAQLENDATLITAHSIFTKMNEIHPRQLLTPSDENIVANSEMFTFYQMMHVAPTVQALDVILNVGFPWYVDELKALAQTTAHEVMLSDLKPRGVRALGFLENFLASVGIDVKKLEDETHHSALVKTWINVKSLQHRADYYKNNMGFTVYSWEFDQIVMRTTRGNIIGRYKRFKPLTSPKNV